MAIRKFYVVAGSMLAASYAARAEGWRRLCAGNWADEIGRDVDYVESVQILERKEVGSIVFLAPGWETKLDRADLGRLRKQRSFKFEEIGQ